MLGQAFFMSGSGDILIIGGGVIGLSIARELYKQGIRGIAIVERGRIGEEASWAAGGMLSPDIESDPNGHFYRLCRRSLSMYPQFADELADETGVDIELDRTGTLALDLNDSGDLGSIYQEQRKARVNVHSLTAREVLELEPNLTDRVTGGLFYVDNWQVENRKLLDALKAFCVRNEISVEENVTVEKLSIENGKVVGVETSSGRITADHVVLATGAWTSLIKIGDRDVPFEIKPILGQMICFKPADNLLHCVIHGPQGYLVPRHDGRILAGSTSEDRGFEKGVMKDVISKLHAMAAELVPALSDEQIVDSWSGLRPCSTDELPIIGNIPGVSNLTVATGHYRNGILLAPVTASLVANSIAGIEEFPKPFLPDRFSNDSAAAMGN
jgi:glycine oxidase